MEIVYKNISKVVEYENNPRNNEKAIEKVAESIKEFGFKVPIVVDGNGVIVAGHTRIKAAKLLGYEEVPCIVADDLNEEQIKAFRLADNKVGEFAEWDFEKLEEELASIGEIDMEQFGFDFEAKEETEKTDLSDSLKEEFKLVIDCENENELENLYTEMTERGYECKVSTL